MLLGGFSYKSYINFFFRSWPLHWIDWSNNFLVMWLMYYTDLKVNSWWWRLPLHLTWHFPSCLNYFSSSMCIIRNKGVDDWTTEHSTKNNLLSFVYTGCWESIVKIKGRRFNPRACWAFAHPHFLLCLLTKHKPVTHLHFYFFYICLHLGQNNLNMCKIKKMHEWHKYICSSSLEIHTDNTVTRSTKSRPCFAGVHH